MDKILKILIIDDRSFRKIVTRMMGRAGLNVETTEAINCDEGVEKRNKNVYDCALLDYQLPDANGIHLLQEILHFGGPVPQQFLLQEKAMRRLSCKL